MDEEADNDEGDGAQREVDVEAPSPGNFVTARVSSADYRYTSVNKRCLHERAAQNWADNRGHSHGSSQHANVARPCLQRGRASQNDDGARIQARGAHACNGAAGDEGARVGCSRAYKTPQLEDGDGDQVHDPGGENGEQLAEQQLEGARGEEVGGGIPANVAEGMEVVSDPGDGGGDDGFVPLQPPE